MDNRFFKPSIPDSPSATRQPEIVEHGQPRSPHLHQVITNTTEVHVLQGEFEGAPEPLREGLSQTLGKTFMESKVRRTTLNIDTMHSSADSGPVGGQVEPSSSWRGSHESVQVGVS